MLEAQAGLLGVTVNGKNPVQNMLDTAAAANISILRTLVSGVTPQLPLELSPGQHGCCATCWCQHVDVGSKWVYRWA